MPNAAKKQGPAAPTAVEVPQGSIWMKLVTAKAEDLRRVEEAYRNAVGARAEVDRACRRNMSTKAVSDRLSISDAAARGLVKVLAEVIGE